MNTRNRRNKQRAPFGVGSSVKPRLDLIEQVPNRAYDQHPACSSLPERTCQHPLTNLQANDQLNRCEESVKNRFDRVVPFLRAVAGIPLGTDYITRVQELAQSSLGHTFPETMLKDNWIKGHNFHGMFGYSTFRALNASAEQFRKRWLDQADEASSFIEFLLDCGFHAIDISPCSDGRIKGLLPFILRLPLSDFIKRKAYAGALFDVEEDLNHWKAVELHRYREGIPNTADEPTRYLKIAVYHYSSSDPTHQGCAAHGSNDHAAVDAAMARLIALRQAVENAFCCGASVDILLIGVDTDTDAIRVHIPDENGDLNEHRFVDNAKLYAETLNLSADAARIAVHGAIVKANNSDGWARGKGIAHEGMRRFIATLLINNLSQIDYVVHKYSGRYPADQLGHAERYISVGESIDEIQIRNMSYYAHLHTVEENTNDLDVGIKIFRKLNVERGLPIPIAVHFRYDDRVPGSRERMKERAIRVRNAISARHHELNAAGFLQFHTSVQARAIGSPIEEVASA
ncbi:MAG: carboxysome shell carbonic anhydrase [Halothiobacillus sp. 14-56-357]|jgi:carboxysome shell carbonic anhydrase|uniref:carboxysome shell carbonic anhydrase n=1 Tax=Halothiobacillus sp. 15-55-196 TaxID=1970382 RepID=UPI000BC56D9D|nr:carboxysome shell carbonic anhydrase [Halothiobacillus sp. 15-55-196]OZB37581.1 MAG: carboxysome shell carbonic anhydrase [Halothiobacillus sp. 15-55-196]OZB56017.1 MAG: carboxysome shell carbonic anhydrase [Halothiobacillus sp. 14-56-357]OZB76989.1 MAG: carboxysome shell carbonic anhydrase [Halothiobacillus sp. 13-55-115]